MEELSSVTRNEARARVEAFVADFHARWQRSGKSPDPSGFDPRVFETWAAELSGLLATHCTPGMRTGREGALSSSPAHHPGAEQITDVEVDEDTATVRSVIHGAGNNPYYYKYQLRRGDDGWRISRLSTFLNPPGAPFVDPARAKALMLGATSEAALPDLPAHLELDVPGLFTAGRMAGPFENPAPIEVLHLGNLTCASGVLAVLDLGFGDAHFVPLARRIVPGTYPVEVATVSEVTVAVRLRLSEAPAVSWHPAEFTDGTRSVGVDVGSVALLDAGSLVQCQAQRIEELLQEHAALLVGAPGTMFGLAGEAMDAVMVSSGYGDGTYPCYWGVAADGGLTSLLVDFRVLAEDIVRATRVPFQPGPVSSPELAGLELQIAAYDRAFVISSRGGDVTGLRVVAPDGTLLMDGNRLGTFITEGRSSKTWRPDAAPPPGSILEVTRYLGYRHI
ncbi:DUF4241 domain-containing protein [Pseudarthrobacter sp. NPDC092424]|uniref:DUF4241 domain-containing protein n=1 Tax=Pseudarthrobacter sp. NPDC092424 TaxID=3364415 RepID=UPI0037F5CAE2